MTRFVYALYVLGAAFSVLSLPSYASTNCEEMFGPAGRPEYRTQPDDAVELCRIGYVLSHNGDHRTPDWVVEHLTPEVLKGSADRNALGNPFAEDKDVPDGERAVLSDYRAADSKGRKYDRGHMAPAADMKYSDDAMRQSFLLSNMAPQIGPGLNRDIWAALESLVRDWTCERLEIIVATGPLYEGEKIDLLGSGVSIPTGFYKVIYDVQHNRAIAFILPNEKINKNGKTSWERLKDFVVSVSEVEDRTNLTFFSKRTHRTQLILKREKSIMWPDRGACEE